MVPGADGQLDGGPYKQQRPMSGSSGYGDGGYNMNNLNNAVGITNGAGNAAYTGHAQALGQMQAGHLQAGQQSFMQGSQVTAPTAYIPAPVGQSGSMNQPNAPGAGRQSSLGYGAAQHSGMSIPGMTGSGMSGSGMIGSGMPAASVAANQTPGYVPSAVGAQNYGAGTAADAAAAAGVAAGLGLLLGNPAQQQQQQQQYQQYQPTAMTNMNMGQNVSGGAPGTARNAAAGMGTGAVGANVGASLGSQAAGTASMMGGTGAGMGAVQAPGMGGGMAPGIAVHAAGGMAGGIGATARAGMGAAGYGTSSGMGYGGGDGGGADPSGMGGGMMGFGAGAGGFGGMDGGFGGQVMQGQLAMMQAGGMPGGALMATGAGMLEGLPHDAVPTLFADTMPPDITKRELAHIFRPYDGYKELRLVVKEKNGRAGDAVRQAMAFVEFENEFCATRALRTLQGYCFDLSADDSPCMRLAYAKDSHKKPHHDEPRPYHGAPAKGRFTPRHGPGSGPSAANRPHHADGNPRESPHSGGGGRPSGGGFTQRSPPPGGRASSRAGYNAPAGDRGGGFGDGGGFGAGRGGQGSDWRGGRHGGGGHDSSRADPAFGGRGGRGGSYRGGFEGGRGGRGGRGRSNTYRRT